MAFVYDLEAFLNEIAPFNIKEDWDNAGLLTGLMDMEITGIQVSLDITADTIEEALQSGANVLVSHHPIIFRGIKSITDSDYTGRLLYTLIKNNMAAICCHTNLDKACGGVNDVLAARLGLENIRGFIQTEDNYFLGRIGDLPSCYLAQSFAEHVKEALGCSSVSFCEGQSSIRTVALMGGAGGDYIEAAINSGVDAYITSDLKYHQFLDCENLDFTLVDAGHYYTENIVIPVLAKRIQERFKDINVYTSLRQKSCIKHI